MIKQMGDISTIIHELKSRVACWWDSGEDTSYRWVDVAGTKTKVYSKYLTGKVDNDNDTNVAHGISDVDKILQVTGQIWDDDGNAYQVYGIQEVALASVSFLLSYNATNVRFNDVGVFLRDNNYRIKIEYYL